MTIEDANAGYPWGKPFTYSFYPLVDEQPIEPSTDAPAIYIYPDSATPTLAQARVGGGSPVKTITSWTRISSCRYDIAVSAIDDPHPDQEQPKRVYLIAVNFTLTAGGQVQTATRPLDMVRVRGHHKAIDVDEAYIQKIYPTIGSYASSVELTNFITVSKRELQTHLRNKNYEWSQLHRPDRFADAVAYKTIAHAMLAQTRAVGDHFDKKFNVFQKMFEDHVETLRIEYNATLSIGEAPAERRANIAWIVG